MFRSCPFRLDFIFLWFKIHKLVSNWNLCPKEWVGFYRKTANSDNVCDKICYYRLPPTHDYEINYVEKEGFLSKAI